MNLLVTHACGRRCAFCFARAETEGAAAPLHMSLALIDSAMDFLERSGERELRLLGGEPTRHPEFETIVRRALDRGFHVHLFSNCMMPRRTADFLAALPEEALSVLANVSANPLDTPEQRDRVEYALSALGPRARPGITVSGPDFDVAPLVGLIERHGLRRRIRVGLAQPVFRPGSRSASGADNAFLPPDRYRDVGRALVRAALACEREDILIGFDCGLTLCMFADEDFAVLARCSEGFRSVCAPVLDLGPDGLVRHCLPLSGLPGLPGLRLGDFRDRPALVRAMRERTRAYRAFGCRPECLDCRFLRRGQCRGGCLAHAVASFAHRGP